jgi:hypothetical protein
MEALQEPTAVRTARRAVPTGVVLKITALEAIAARRHDIPGIGKFLN